MLRSVDAGVASLLVWHLGQRRQFGCGVAGCHGELFWAGQPDAPVLGHGEVPLAPALAEAQHFRGSTWQASRGGSGGDRQAEYAAVAE